MEQPRRPAPNPAKPAPPQRSGMMVILIILMIILALYLIWNVLLAGAPSAEVTYDVFWKALKENPSNVIEVKYENPYEIHFKTRNPIKETIKSNNNQLLGPTEEKPRTTDPGKTESKTKKKTSRRGQRIYNQSSNDERGCSRSQTHRL
jgi:hypothetical protein